MVFISGLINIETTLQIDGFPLHYNPVNYPFNRIHSTVSGVGMNLALALQTLGEEVVFLSLIGKDPQGKRVKDEFTIKGLTTTLLMEQLSDTPLSVILFDQEGRRQIHVDLKDIQEQKADPSVYLPILKRSTLAMLCNINFSRPLLSQAREQGIPIATDVHVLSDIHDPYNQDFLRLADIVFLSNENIRGQEQDFARALMGTYNMSVLVIGMGRDGALLMEQSRSDLIHMPSLYTRPVVNTVGAGDALFSSFNYFYARNRDAEDSLRKAMAFASWKIGSRGAAEGFPSLEKMESILEQCRELK